MNFLKSTMRIKVRRPHLTAFRSPELIWMYKAERPMPEMRAASLRLQLRIRSSTPVLHVVLAVANDREHARSRRSVSPL